MPRAMVGSGLVAAIALTGCLSPVRRSEGDLDAGFLDDAWTRYKGVYVHADGYVIDRTRNGGEVTSEGQAYALLRAAWTGDRATFTKVLSWSDGHLLRADGLLSWRWSAAGGGKVLDVNSATDADADMAFALIVAASRFDRPDYLSRARATLRAIRANARVEVSGGWFPAAGNWATSGRVVNLSYFTPYAYPYFDLVDPEGRWGDVTTAGYSLLDAALTAPARLPPDFMVVGVDGALSPPADEGLRRTFSFDAVRIFWRVALDCRLHRRPAACRYPGGDALAELLRRDGRLVTEYQVDGTRVSDQESLTFYACVLPMLDERAPDLATGLRQTRLSPEALRPVLDRPDRYFDLNWVWFGLALSGDLIVERTPTVDQIAAMAEKS